MRGDTVSVKLIRQLAVILILSAFFVFLNFMIYSNFTYRYEDKSREIMKEQSIEIDKYLPFDGNSKIVKHDSALKLTGQLPVLDGATALFPVFSAFVNSVYPSESVVFDGQNFTAESSLQKTGTGGAYKAIVDGGADIIFTAKPSREQTEYAQGRGAELVCVPIGYEAFVFIVNAKNPVESLTSRQIRGIYSGLYKNWRELGADSAPVIPVQRVEGSGSQTAMISFMQDTPLMKRSPNIIGRAIGYSFRYYVSDLAGKENVKMIAVDGVYPTAENIRNETYPVTESFYAVYRADNKNENIPVLLDWVLSGEGQYIVEKSGYVPAKN
jgi:phosphate transport system substrate-binding protein